MHISMLQDQFEIEHNKISTLKKLLILNVGNKAKIITMFV